MILYLLATVLIGVFTSRYVKDSKDFILAGRRLPLLVSASALFATWFGSETVLGASSEFIQHGLYGVIEDPFGAALCLLLVGIFFARPLYRMNILTFGDFYRIRFDKKTEIVSSLFMIPSYFGWVAAQLVALGIILNVLAGISILSGILLSAGLVTIYTVVGGMWAISVTDFIQTIIIIAGLIILACTLVPAAGGLSSVIDQAPEGFFKFLPDPEPKAMMYYFAAWATIGLGSIPQQDVFQRVMASRTEKTAVRAAFLSSAMYLSVGFLPLLIGLCAKILYPELLTGEGQTILPQVVLLHTNLFVQILFFGALLSAIMSTTSGAMLAPATILAENLVKPLRKKAITESQFLILLRMSVILVAILSTIMASLSSNIYELVAESSVFSLVSLFVPMVAGLYWKKASSWGAILSMAGGMAGWILFERLPYDIPSLIPALAISTLGMILGTLAWPDQISHKS